MSDSMVKMMSTSRKDDLESLMYILSYLYKGKLPVLDFINQNIESIQMSQFKSKILSFREKYSKLCHTKIKESLPEQMSPAFTYIMTLNHTQKPDYNLIKLWIAADQQDENNIFKKRYVIENQKLAKSLLYESSLVGNHNNNQPRRVVDVSRSILDG